MSNQDDYQAKLSTILAIAAEETKSPNMPVDVKVKILEGRDKADSKEVDYPQEVLKI